jgi:hypothetical protein
MAGVLAWGCLGCGGAGHPDAAGAATAVVRQGDVADRVLLTGVLHPVSAIDLVAPSTDQATLTIRWMAGDGAAVKAGDRVVVFDDAPFTGKLQEHHTQLREAQAQFRLFQNASVLRLAEKQLDVRRQEIARDKARLLADLPPDLMTSRTVQANQLALFEAEAGLGRSRKELAAMIAQEALEERLKQIEFDKTRRWIDAAEQAIGALELKAPRDGVVVIAERSSDGHKFRTGDAVQDGAAIVSLPDLTRPMEVRADLVDVDDGRVGLHAAATCTLDAYPGDPLACTVEAVAPVARVKEGSASLKRTFSVTLALAPCDPARLRPGMAVKVAVRRPALHGLVIPRGAIVADPGDDGRLDGRIARVRRGTGEVHDVTLAACDAQQCAVARGLAEGDVVSIGPGGRS